MIDYKITEVRTDIVKLSIENYEYEVYEPNLNSIKIRIMYKNSYHYVFLTLYNTSSDSLLKDLKFDLNFLSPHIEEKIPKQHSKILRDLIIKVFGKSNSSKFKSYLQDKENVTTNMNKVLNYLKNEYIKQNALFSINDIIDIPAYNNEKYDIISIKTTDNIFKSNAGSGIEYLINPINIESKNGIHWITQEQLEWLLSKDL